jgi:hypothetical protein
MFSSASIEGNRWVSRCGTRAQFDVDLHVLVHLPVDGCTRLPGAVGVDRSIHRTTSIDGHRWVSGCSSRPRSTLIHTCSRNAHVDVQLRGYSRLAGEAAFDRSTSIYTYSSDARLDLDVMIHLEVDGCKLVGRYCSRCSVDDGPLELWWGCPRDLP